MEFRWLPKPSSWSEALADAAEAEDAWDALRAIANLRLDAMRTGQVDRILTDTFDKTPPPGLATRPVRLAILSSSTVAHLVPGIRVAALRRGIWLQVYVAPYGAYAQDLYDPDSRLQTFAPSVILFAFDVPHLTSGIDPSAATVHDAATPILSRVRDLWRHARARFGCPIVQQTLLPTALPLVGSNEHRLACSGAAVPWLNHQLREAADADGVDLLALDTLAARYGLDAWHDPVWWLRAKHEVKVSAAPFYGEMLARILAAGQGLSRKCVVLDLDNTLWGGLVGDDGLGGLVLGQGSAEGEAYLAFQTYLRALTARGIVLAVVSKNDEANALEAVETHPEMILRRRDFAAFFANWDDKAQNLRRVAATIGIGLDALVFVDDNPFERNLVRAELPMVAVPEMPEDPAFYATTLADAGYFEALAVTDDDRARATRYAANADRGVAAAEAADLPTYLAGLQMRLCWKPFDRIGLERIVQLINKTNQFNLTTRRVTEDEVVALMADETSLCLQFRLLDRFGDNGMIGVVVGRSSAEAERTLDIWLMSCRVLGRQVENAMLDVVARQARAMGDRTLVGLYRPSAKNGMVEDLYGRLGFVPMHQNAEESAYRLALATFAPASTFIAIEAG